MCLRIHMHVGDEMKIPSNSFTVFLRSTGGVNVPRNKINALKKKKKNKTKRTTKG